MKKSTTYSMITTLLLVTIAIIHSKLVECAAPLHAAFSELPVWYQIVYVGGPTVILLAFGRWQYHRGLETGEWDSKRYG